MKQGKLVSVYTLLGVIMLAFSISMILSFNNLRKYEKLAQSEITDATWVIYQAEIELTRFLNTLDVYMYSEDSIFSREDVIERMEIFWSRLPLFLEGSEGRKLARIGNTQKAARAALAFAALEMGRLAEKLPFPSRFLNQPTSSPLAEV